MGIVLVLAGGVLSIASFVCSMMILIDAFQNAIWKGVVGLLCGIYLVYYGLVEYDRDNKWPIVLTAIVGGGIGGAMLNVGLATMGGGG